ncbi:MAG TPA: hypothetical protein VJI73_04120 [Candidatus Paceibacterota bacterium]
MKLVGDFLDVFTTTFKQRILLKSQILDILNKYTNESLNESDITISGTKIVRLSANLSSALRNEIRLNKDEILKEFVVVFGKNAPHKIY